MNDYVDTLERVFGVYTDRARGRQSVQVCHLDGTRRYVPYPRFLVEVLLGRQLDPHEETVDHLDQDFTNNS